MPSFVSMSIWSNGPAEHGEIGVSGDRGANVLADLWVTARCGTRVLILSFLALVLVLGVFPLTTTPFFAFGVAVQARFLRVTPRLLSGGVMGVIPFDLARVIMGAFLALV